jgi:hypothetical protein
MPEFRDVFEDKEATQKLIEKYQNDVITRFGKSLEEL